MNMIERVARAICKAAVGGTEFEATFNWVDYVDEARAAIEAMREPTEAMLQANEDSGYTWSCIVDCEGVTTAYDTMIDAALKEE